MDFFKINEKGEYTPYYGLTVVSHIQKSDIVFWENVYEWMKNSELSQFYAPLPVHSYHMTAINLFNIQSIGSDEWENFVTTNHDFFQELDDYIGKNKFQPTVQIKEVYISSVIQLILKLPLHQELIIKNIADKFNLSALIPPYFHITLAYEYQFADENLVKKFQTEILQKLSNFPNNFLLKPPQLCYFNDMTAFYPWDGKSYPFTGMISSFRP